MIEYYILQEYNRLKEEKRRLEEAVRNLQYQRIIVRNQRGKKYFYTRSSGPDIHEKALSREEYDAIAEKNSELKDINRKLAEIDAAIAKIEPYRPKYEAKINEEYERLSAKAAEQNKKVHQSNFRPDTLKLVSARGDVVRSKTELIIADTLYYNRIFYEYENPDVAPPLHPDFYIKDNIHGIPIIWEHFGKMNDPNYVRDYVRKLEIFKANGYTPGYNLIATFEYYEAEDNSKSVVFDSGKAEKVAKEWFGPCSKAA